MARMKRGSASARADSRNSIYTLAARVAVVVLAFYLTVPSLTSEPVFAGFDAPLAATIAGALLIIACGVLALLARRNRLLAGEIARLEGEADALDDRNWELKEAAERSRTFLEGLG